LLTLIVFAVGHGRLVYFLSQETKIGMEVKSMSSEVGWRDDTRVGQ